MAIKGLPYDGWYNGSAKMMIANGTYADFRDQLEERLALGKITEKQLKEWDKEWDALSRDEKLRRRAIVVQDNTPQEVVFTDKEGKQRKVYRSKPSDNNNLDPERNRKKGKKEQKRPVGALTDENNPILAEEPVKGDKPQPDSSSASPK